jgi:dephospho-CoA kinase
MKIIGLTGSIATGKSFVAEIFKKNNVIVFSSDYVVAELLRTKEVVDILIVQPELKVAIKEGNIDKNILSNIVFKDKEALKILEGILHPLVEKERILFIERNSIEKFMLFEVPLLFEKKYQIYCDKVITTYCSERTQMERALRRKNLDKNRLEFIMKRQMPSNEKTKLTDYAVYTDISYEYTKSQIERILIKEGIK